MRQIVFLWLVCGEEMRAIISLFTLLVGMATVVQASCQADDVCNIDGHDVCGGYAAGDDICAQNRDLTKKMAILNAKLDLLIERFNVTNNGTIPLFPANSAGTVVPYGVVISLATIFTAIAMF